MLMVPEKTCNKCGETKPISMFGTHSHTKDRHRPECKECHAEYHRQARVTNGRDKYRKYEFSRRYGATLDVYHQMFAAQDGKCAICGSGPNGRWQALAIDHNHTTNKIRALLCNACNTALGGFKESEELLLKAASYLKTHRQ